MSHASGVFPYSVDIYHADPCPEPSLSSSIAKILCTRSPLHAWTAHPRLNPDLERQEEAKFDIGTVAHALLLQGEDVAVVVDAPDWRTNKAKDERDAAYAAGQVPLLGKHWDAVRLMVDAARVQLDASAAEPPLFTDGRPEQTLIWHEDGVTCRARLDWLRTTGTAIDDYKTTTQSANPEKWSRTLFNMGYDIQAAFYLRGLKAVRIDGKRADFQPEFRWAIQETSPPYALSVMSLTPAALELADAKVEHAINLWRQCMATNTWPGYPTEVCYAELPGWEEARWLEKEEREVA